MLEVYYCGAAIGERDAPFLGYYQFSDSQRSDSKLRHQQANSMLKKYQAIGTNSTETEIQEMRRRDKQEMRLGGNI
jgi:hypothetical protein